MKKRVLALIAVVAMVVVFAAGNLVTAAEEGQDFDTVSFAIASTKTENQDVGKAILSFKEILEEKLGDKVDISLFLGGQLYSAPEQVQALIGNEVQIIFDISTVLQVVDNQLDMLLLPGIFGGRDVATCYQIIDSEEAHDLLFSGLEGKGIRILGLVNGGKIIISNNTRELNTPEDCAGLKIRAAGAIESQIVTALGAATMVTENSETYSALQQGLVDGVFNPIKIFAERSFFEVNQYVTDLGYIYFPTNFIGVNKNWFEGLPQPVQEAILEAADAVITELRANVDTVDEASFAKAEENGTVITHPEDPDAWNAAVASVIEQYYEEIGEDKITAFQEIIANH